LKIKRELLQNKLSPFFAKLFTMMINCTVMF
jgi:hypothetical protein